MEYCKHNLPTQPTSFVGRQTEVAELISLLGNPYCRLVTLVGPGGIGKTRMALKTAEVLLEMDSAQASFPYPDGIYFVALQSVSSVEQIVPTIIRTFDLEYVEDKNSKAALLGYLRDKRLLLILDNIEHLVAAAPLFEELLHGVPNIKLLVTSRVVLNLAEEWLFPVDGMAHAVGEADDNDDVETADAVVLFYQRAQRLRHDFSLVEEEQQVVQICRLVEGTPLAIELAATWLRHLSCAEIAAEIQRGLEILQSDELGIADRHRTMRAVFDHSWQLLSQAERELFASLSIFQGGFLRAAAEAVAGATLPLLSSLVDQSLLRVSATGRYTIHELQRQYATEQLATSPERQQAVAARHSAYYLRCIAKPVRDYLGEKSKQLAETIEAEISNIFAAWYWAVDHRRISDLHMATEGLYWFAWLSTYHEECEKALRYAVEMLKSDLASNEQRLTYAHALALHGIMGIWLGQDQTENAELVESVALLRKLPGAQRELANAVGGLGWSAYADAKLEKAKTLLYEAVELDQATEQFELQAWIYCLLGDVVRRQGNYQESEHWYQQALQLGRAIGDQRTIINAFLELGRLAMSRGEYGKAHRDLSESLSIARSHHVRSFTVSALGSLGQLAEETGALDLAAEYQLESVDMARRWGREINLAQSLGRLAWVRTAQGDYATAADLFQEAVALEEKIHSEPSRGLLAGMGKLALHTQDYGRARLLYETCLAQSRQAGDHPMTAQALTGLGLAALALRERTDARQHLLGALQEGLRIGFAPLLLDTVTAVAELLATDGDLAYAVQVATLAQEHVAGTAETKRRAHKLLTQAGQALATATAAPATQKAADTKLEAVAKRLVANLSRAEGMKVQPTAPAPLHPLIEPLSERELQVLRLVAAGKSNRQIGGELYLALGTVKAHLNHIFQKLAVQSRTEAVVRAIELKLL